MWQTWYDQREGYQCWRSHGRSIVPVFAADTSLTRFVEWVASHYQLASFGVADALATRLIRRRPEGLREGAVALVRHLGGLAPPVTTAAADRMELLFHVLGLLVERTVRGDLRPDGPREKPPTRYRHEEVEEAARHFQPRCVDGLARLVKTHDVVRRLMWESRWGAGPESPDGAVIAIHDLPLIPRFLEELPFDTVEDGIRRGVLARSAFRAFAKLHNLGRLPENDHAIWLPRDTWHDLAKLLDPLARLAAIVRRTRAAPRLCPSERVAHLQMESVLVAEPIRQGARFTIAACQELEELARKLKDGSADDAPAHEALRTIIEAEKAASNTDARCVLT